MSQVARQVNQQGQYITDFIYATQIAFQLIICLHYTLKKQQGKRFYSSFYCKRFAHICVIWPSSEPNGRNSTDTSAGLSRIKREVKRVKLVPDIATTIQDATSLLVVTSPHEALDRSCKTLCAI